MPSFSAILCVISVLISTGTTWNHQRNKRWGERTSEFLSRQQLKRINDFHQTHCPYQESSGKFCATDEYERELENFERRSRDILSLDESMAFQMKNEASTNSTELKYCCYFSNEACFYRCTKANPYIVDGFPDNYPLLILLDRLVVFANLSLKMNRKLKWDHAELKCSLEKRNLTTLEEQNLTEDIARNSLYFNTFAEVLFETSNPYKLARIFMDYQAYMDEAKYMNFPSSIDKLRKLPLDIFKDISNKTVNQLKDGTASCEDSHFWQLKVGINSRKIFDLTQDDFAKDLIRFELRDVEMSI